MYCIYRLYNTINGRSYIGQTVNATIRGWAHFGQLKSNKHPNKAMQSDFRKGHKIVLEVLRENLRLIDANRMERDLIISCENRYNVQIPKSIKGIKKGRKLEDDKKQRLEIWLRKSVINNEGGKEAKYVAV